jgi:hypothetical protein
LTGGDGCANNEVRGAPGVAGFTVDGGVVVEVAARVDTLGDGGDSSNDVVPRSGPKAAGLPGAIFKRCAAESDTTRLLPAVPAAAATPFSEVGSEDAAAAAAAAATAAVDDAELELCRRSNETLVARASAILDGTVMGLGKQTRTQRRRKTTAKRTVSEALEKIVDAGG